MNVIKNSVRGVALANADVIIYVIIYGYFEGV